MSRSGLLWLVLLTLLSPVLPWHGDVVQPYQGGVACARAQGLPLAGDRGARPLADAACPRATDAIGTPSSLPAREVTVPGKVVRTAARGSGGAFAVAALQETMVVARVGDAVRGVAAPPDDSRAIAAWREQLPYFPIAPPQPG